MRTYIFAFLLVVAVTVADACAVAEEKEVAIDKRFLVDDFKDFLHKAEKVAKKFVKKVEDVAKKIAHTAEKTAKKVLGKVDIVNLLDKAVNYIDSTVAVLGCSKIAEEVKDAVNHDNKGGDDDTFKDICKTALGLLEKIAKKGLAVLEEAQSKHD